MKKNKEPKIWRLQGYKSIVLFEIEKYEKNKEPKIWRFQGYKSIV